jgi:predicted negative regulator of RcsB-dependent stress response
MSLDLQEQEQLDELKHYWAKYGNLITWALIAVFGAFAAWNGWQWWQRKEAVQASAIYDELDRAVGAKDLGRVERAFADIKEKFGSTAYAEMAGLLASKSLFEGGKTDQAEATLRWVSDNAKDKEYRSMAMLRLASLMLERKAYDDALKLLAKAPSEDFAPLFADLRGDVLQAQGKRDEAKAEYKRALDGLDSRLSYRQVIELKLNALGGSAA